MNQTVHKKGEKAIVSRICLNQICKNKQLKKSNKLTLSWEIISETITFSHDILSTVTQVPRATSNTFGKQDVLLHVLNFVALGRSNKLPLEI